MNSFLTKIELQKIGFKYLGENTKISRLANFYSPNKISIGNNVRIDDFCILSGNINLKNNIHISAYSALYGNSGIVLENNTGISSGCVLFSETDDFTSSSLIGPQHIESKRKIIKGRIILEEHSQLGTKSVVMPGITIQEGAVTGAFTFINLNLNPWSVYVGSPAKYLKSRPSIK
jgi:acetyltransferase-like isoleucine patch superfamily enzyme